MKRKMHPTKIAVMKVFLSNPFALTREIAQAVVEKAEKGGTCFRADFLKLDKLGGCRCG